MVVAAGVAVVVVATGAAAVRARVHRLAQATRRLADASTGGDAPGAEGKGGRMGKGRGHRDGSSTDTNTNTDGGEHKGRGRRRGAGTQ